MKLRLVVITVIVTIVLVVVMSSLSPKPNAELKRTTILEAAESPKAAVSSPETIKKATDFAQKATIGHIYEVESSRLALDESKNERIRNFAEKMIEHHSAADQELRSIIDSSSVDKNMIPDALDAKHVAKIEKLKAAKGKEFDNIYIAQQRAAHGEAVVVYKNYSNSGQDRALQNYAKKILPLIEEHNRAAKKL